MRRRILNPEFFVDPDIIANLDFAGRLFYQGLWCVAEDSGVFEPNPLGLKMKIFPGDNLDISVIQEYYQTLLSLGKIIEFKVNGRTYAWLKNFHKHQRLDRPSPPSLPLPPWVIWHGEEEYGLKERHKWHYEVVNENIPNPDSFDDMSSNSRRIVDDTSTNSRLEKNRKEGNMKGSEGKENKVPPKDISATESDTVNHREINQENAADFSSPDGDAAVPSEPAALPQSLFPPDCQVIPLDNKRKKSRVKHPEAQGWAKPALDYFYQRWQKKYGLKPPAKVLSFARDTKRLLDSLSPRDHPLPLLQKLMDLYFSIRDPFIQENGHSFGVFLGCIPRLIAELKKHEARPEEVDLVEAYLKYEAEWGSSEPGG